MGSIKPTCYPPGPENGWLNQHWDIHGDISRHQIDMFFLGDPENGGCL